MSNSDATFAKKRLVRDLKELLRESAYLPTISALPTSNIFEWHCNLRPDEGPYAGTVFHLVLKFPDTYPQSPPEVFLCTSIDHPNVFGGADYFTYDHPFICLDMLQVNYTNQPYVGWSSAYSVSSILLQLQSFLFAENVPQHGGWVYEAPQNTKSITWAIREAREFSCEILDSDGEVVVHSHNDPWPPLPKYNKRLGLSRDYVYGNLDKKMSQTTDSKLVIAPWKQSTIRSSGPAFNLYAENFPALNESDATTSVSPIPAPASIPAPTMDTQNDLEKDFALIVPSAVYSHMFGFLRPNELFKARDVCSTWRKIIITYNIFERSQVACFHAKATLDDEAAILGVGLKVRYYRGPNSPLKEVSSPLDILSLEAFEEQGVRTGVWGKEEFEHFLPLIFNRKHAATAIPVIEQTVFEIMKMIPPPPYAPAAEYPANSFQPWMIWQLLSILMNTMVVQMMKSLGSKRSQSNETIHRHASEKALEGYCAFHHVLLYFARRYPSIETMANRQVDAFISSRWNRHKRQTPNLGTLLVCLTLSQKGWAPLWKPLILENFDRNVRWLLQKHPEIGTDTLTDDERIRKTFYGTTTSMRLLMFQVYFMKHIGRPAGTRGPSDVLQRYEKRLGRPTTAQKEDLQQACKAILAVDSWNEWCARCGVPPLTKEKLVKMLQQAVINSRKKKYHFNEGFDQIQQTRSSSARARTHGGAARHR